MGKLTQTTAEVQADLNEIENIKNTGSEGNVFTKGASGQSWGALPSGVDYITTAPTEANTSGRLIFVVLTSEPATKYDGYIYFITEA